MFHGYITWLWNSPHVAHDICPYESHLIESLSITIKNHHQKSPSTNITRKNHRFEGLPSKITMKNHRFFGYRVPLYVPGNLQDIQQVLLEALRRRLQGRLEAAPTKERGEDDGVKLGAGFPSACFF